MAFRAYVEGYVALVQEELRLQDWVLKVDWKTPPPDECHAAIVPHTNSKHASIVLHPTFMDLDNEARRQALVHEVMHCHVFDVHHTAELMIEKSTRAKSTFDMAAEVLNARVEILTDVLADVMAPYFPPFDAP
jgi:hypothetical protein